jgi:NAD(P)-dependent dehydrogenase (short-subunit alcohol dehydrogenase family)
MQGVADKLPVRKIADPDEVAEAVLLLMTNRSITGESLHVDGGARLV